MPDRWVANASPVILLHRIGRLDLLGALGSATYIPEEVAEEVGRGALAIPREELHAALGREGGVIVSSAWESVQRTGVAPPPPRPEELASWDLGVGETRVIECALRDPSCGAVLDDRQARRAAQSLGVPVVGTLGVVLRAKRRGLVAAARPLFEALRADGLHASESLLEAALRDVGE